jgi:sulfoxide reductase heme-binding subunit YedZ
MLGLFAFFYAALHFTTYIWLDQFFDWKEILVDIPKRPFITIGFISFVLLMPLAVTSTNAMQRRLKKRWLTLHKLVYLIPVLVIIHFIWSLKADYAEPLMYASVFSILMLSRLYHARKKASKG